jgi:hypothetical protein
MPMAVLIFRAWNILAPMPPRPEARFDDILSCQNGILYRGLCLESDDMHGLGSVQHFIAGQGNGQSRGQAGTAFPHRSDRNQSLLAEDFWMISHRRNARARPEQPSARRQCQH